MKKAIILVGGIRNIMQDGLPLPTLDAWTEQLASPSGQRFLAYYDSLVAKSEPMYMAHTERCPFCNQTVSAGRYMLEPVQFRDKQITICIQHIYRHLITDHGVKPVLKFFKAFRRKEYEVLTRLSRCHRIGRGLYLAI